MFAIDSQDSIFVAVKAWDGAFFAPTKVHEMWSYDTKSFVCTTFISTLRWEVLMEKHTNAIAQRHDGLLLSN